MLNIKYQPFSLLYGHSFFWLEYSLISPFHLLPDLQACKCRYVIDQIPAFIFWFVTKVRDNSLCRIIFAIAFLFGQTFYMAIFLVCNFLITAQELTKFSKHYPESLTYKVLYNAPILTNGGRLIITLVNLADRESNLWKIYDNFDTLSINYSRQARTAKLAILLTAPELIANIVESFILAQVVLNSEYYYAFLAAWDPDVFTESLTLLVFYIILLMSGVLNTIIRYRPVVTLLYASTCVSEHLALINSQMSNETDRRVENETKHEPGEHRKQNLKFVGEHYFGSKKDFDLYSSSSQLSQASKTPSADQTEQLQEQQTELNLEKASYSVGNLYELERHLTRVSQFLYDIDRMGPESVLIITAVNFMTYFFLVFYLLYEPNWTTAMASIAVCCARTAPLSMMFIAGSRVESQCKRLVMKLESIYLQNKSQSLIYKQMASSHLSLARTLKILERLNLSCQGLMKVNAATLKNCFIYITTIILIILQYDALMFLNFR